MLRKFEHLIVGRGHGWHVAERNRLTEAVGVLRRVIVRQVEGDPMIATFYVFDGQVDAGLAPLVPNEDLCWYARAVELQPSHKTDAQAEFSDQPFNRGLTPALYAQTMREATQFRVVVVLHAEIL